MKAIQIRYLAPTETRGSRLKVWAEGVKPMIISRKYENEPHEQARIAAQQFISAQKYWGGMTGFGSLPNGDWVATIGV